MARELLFSVTLDDCDVQTFRSGGKGGQNQNKRDTGVRIIHRDSGAVGESREERSQLQNKRKAFKKMVDHPKFKFWLAMRRREIDTGKSIEQAVQEQLAPSYLKTEVRVDGKWRVVDPSDLG